EDQVAAAVEKPGKKGKVDTQTTLRPTDGADRAFWEEQIALLREQQEDNYAVINELVYKMDSLERSRERDMEQRFEMVMRIVKRHTGDQIPEIEQKAQQIYLAQSQDLDSLDAAMGSTALADNSKVTKTPGEAERPEGGSYHGGAFKPIETYINLSGVEKGHYLVANVFKEEANVRNFMEKLKGQGIAT